MDSKVSLKNTLILFLLIFTISGCDNNNPDPSQSRREFLAEDFMKADTNNDGVVSGSEIQSEIQRDFNTMDTNQDGVITEADHVGDEYILEFDSLDVEFEPSNRGELDFDTNGDEVLTLEEYSSEITSRFLEPTDTNDDGQITLDEVLAFHFEPNTGDG